LSIDIEADDLRRRESDGKNACSIWLGCEGNRHGGEVHTLGCTRTDLEDGQVQVSALHRKPDNGKVEGRIAIPGNNKNQELVLRVSHCPPLRT
jgi:hypothetical protein